MFVFMPKRESSGPPDKGGNWSLSLSRKSYWLCYYVFSSYSISSQLPLIISQHVCFLDLFHYSDKNNCSNRCCQPILVYCYYRHNFPQPKPLSFLIPHSSFLIHHSFPTDSSNFLQVYPHYCLTSSANPRVLPFLVQNSLPSCQRTIAMQSLD